MDYIARHIEVKIHEAMSDTPVVVISGPRQAGKSTLAKRIIENVALMKNSKEYKAPSFQGTCLTLDDPDILAASKIDPIGLLDGLQKPILIDEIQRNSELLLIIKSIVDKSKQPGQFLLTGSANLLTLPKITESLAGRIEIIELLPFSQSELQNNTNNIMELLFESDFKPNLNHSNIDVIPNLIKGGYPEVQNRTSRRSASWFNAYIKAIIQRDIKDVFEIHKIKELSQMVKILAVLNANLVSANGISSKLPLDHKTVRKYISALENLYLIREIPGWHRNELKRVTRQSKINFIDSGLLCALRGITEDKILKDRNLAGNVFESFVYAELVKHANVSNEEYTFFHYRDTLKNEVDLIVENSFGDAIGIEIKLTKTASMELFKGLNRVNSQTKLEKLVVIYTGDKLLSFGENRWVVPVGLFF